MQPDPSGIPGSDPDSAVFLRKLQEPLKYLRGLSVDERTADEIDDFQSEGEPAPRRPGQGSSGKGAPDDGAGPEGPDDAGREGGAGTSIVRRLEKMLGFVPTLDLVAPGEELPEGFGVSDERYGIEGELGSGGMGRVLLVYDQDIRRRVAMKVLRDEVTDKKAVTRFLEEAQATGQLEHPNIAPVYDIGIDKSGRVFFTMKLVRGRNLGEIIRDLAIGRPEVRHHFTLTRLVQILQQASMGVHYGHVRGVIHRDLKPENVMVGDFGEVLVMDWGLAKISGRFDVDTEPGDGIESFRADSGVVTLDGTIQGTLVYMSPEQARGWQDEIDKRTDVFGLGAILYQMLTHHPPYEAKNVREILGKAGAGEIMAPSKRAPRLRIPKSLETICMRALSSAKDDRYQDAKAFHEALQVYLDGTAEAQRRRQEAGGLVQEGREKISEFRRLGDVENALRQQAKESLVGVQPHDSAEKKERSWSLEDEADSVRQKRIRTFNEAASSLRSAIDVDDSCREAKESLANLYWDRFEEAEKVGNVDDMTMYRGLVEQFHEGKYDKVLEGQGSLQVQSDPPDAEVTVYRVEQRGRRRVEVEGKACGQTPLSLDLPMGHHLLVLRRGGYRDTLCPVLVERCGRVTIRARLFRDGEIGDGFVYVPAGEVFLGGDPKSPGSLEVSRRYVEDVFVSRFPVTFREYCEFLDDLSEQGHPDLEERIPRTEREGDCVLLGDDGCYRPDVEKLVDSPTRERYPAGFGWKLPVLAVSWTAANHYCEWLSRRAARKIRLPRDAEWEKSARGVDRSVHPWGDFFDWSFVKGGSSRPEHPQPEPVGAFEHDRSIYGVRDVAGGIREWCEDWLVDGVGRLIRGGHWGTMNPAAFRSAVRSGAKPSMKSSAIGFRVVAEPPPRPS